jgi:uncharacterized RDD family membrane protein YckC
MSDSNPYEAPKVEVGDSGFGGSSAPAGNSRRLANFVVDQLVCMILAITLGAVLAMLGVSLEMLEDPLVDRLVGIAFMLVYYLVCESLFVRTVGKLVTGTKVVNADGTRPGFGQIVGRTFARIVPFEPFSFFGSEVGGWHDRWSGTRVVRTR